MRWANIDTTSDPDIVAAVREEEDQHRAYDALVEDRASEYTPAAWAYCDRPSDLERRRTRADLTLDRDAA